MVQRCILLRGLVPAEPGGTRDFEGTLRPGVDGVGLGIEFGQEPDRTPPSLEAPIGIWVARSRTVGACPGPPEYTAGLWLPPASERAYLSIYEIDQNGQNPVALADMLLTTMIGWHERLGISGEAGRKVCLARLRGQSDAAQCAVLRG